jgi:hypothetical protein
MWNIHYHGNHTLRKWYVTEYTPTGVYNIINFIGTKENLTFDYVEEVTKQC